MEDKDESWETVKNKLWGSWFDFMSWKELGKWVGRQVKKPVEQTQYALHSRASLWFGCSILCQLVLCSVYSGWELWVSLLLLLWWITQNYSSIWKCFFHDPETWYNATSWARSSKITLWSEPHRLSDSLANQPQFREWFPKLPGLLTLGAVPRDSDNILNGLEFGNWHHRFIV